MKIEGIITKYKHIWGGRMEQMCQQQGDEFTKEALMRDCVMCEILRIVLYCDHLIFVYCSSL